MSRGRVVVLVSLGAVAMGAAVTLGALVLGTARAAVGPLPPDALPILADARYVMGLDVARFYASSFHKRYAHDASTRPDALRELEAKTGLDPERDVDRVFAAGGVPGESRGVALIQGRFDPTRIARAIETEKKGVTWKQYFGVTVYIFGEESRSPGALTFLDDQSILLGTEKSVRGVIERKSRPGGAPPSQIRELVGRVKPGSTFWMVGDATVLSALQANVHAAPTLTLPALKSLLVTGDLDPEVTVSIVGDTADAAGAKNVADVVRGLVGLLSLQAAQRPELAQLSSAVVVATDANQVHVDAHIPYALVDALAPRHTPTPPSSPSGALPEGPR
jgi:hypothetical protein